MCWLVLTIDHILVSSCGCWRLSHGLHADLIAISIEPEGYLAWSSRPIGFLKYGRNAGRQRERALRRLEERAVFAEDMGAEVIRTKGHDIARTIVEIVKERHVDPDCPWATRTQFAGKKSCEAR